MLWKNTALFLFAAVAGCGAADLGPDGTGQASSELLPASCGNGVHPGCGDCGPDSSSRTGFSQICYYCEDSYTRACNPVTVGADWNAGVVLYSSAPQVVPPGAATTIHIPLTFQYYWGGWHLTVRSFSASLPNNVVMSLQPGQVATGTADATTGAATLNLPLHATSPFGDFDVTFNLGTDYTLPSGSTGTRRNNILMTMVGTGTSSFVPSIGRSISFSMALYGPTSTWP